MNMVRYKQRECTDTDKINQFLLETRIGVIGLVGGEYPYIVPVNYVWYHGSIYFHGMGSGKKVELLALDPLVSFTVFEEYGTVTDPVPCHADTSYMSVMIFGKSEKVSKSEEMAAALQMMLNKYMPQYYNSPLKDTFIEKYRSSIDGNAVAVYRITPHEMTAKENVVSPNQLFHHTKN